MAARRRTLRSQTARWRVQGAHKVDVSRAGPFDELVVGDWLHVEMMNDGAAFFQIGPLAVWVRIWPSGHAEITGTEDRSCGECGRFDGLDQHAAKCKRGREQARQAREIKRQARARSDGGA